MRVIGAEYERSESHIVYPIALQRTSSGRLKVVRPYYRVGYAFSPHETWYYKEDDVHVLLYLEQLRERYVSLSLCVLYGRQCDAIKQFAKKLWVEEWKSEKEVEQALESLLV